MTPIVRGTATKLGLRKPQPRPSWIITPMLQIPDSVWADFVRHFNEAHSRAVMEIGGVVRQVATGMRRSRPER